MDRTILSAVQEATNSKSRLKESLDSIARSDCNLRLDTSCWISSCTTTNLVRIPHLAAFDGIYLWYI